MKKSHIKNTAENNHILIVRFSALGDVVMLLPTIRGLLKANKMLEVTLVTKSFNKALFEDIERLHVFAADTNGRHRGIIGILKLFKDLEWQKYSHVFDLHRVVRSILLCSLFIINDIKVTAFDKEKVKRKQMTKGNLLHPLQPVYDKYKEPFLENGYEISKFLALPLININGNALLDIDKFLKEQGINNKKMLGIAPFAKHKLKMWPLPKMLDLISELSRIDSVHIFLFGGLEELKSLGPIDEKYDNCTLADMGFKDQIALMHRLDAMLCMDSANMHLASVLGIDIIAIWGGTHPWMGFRPWNNRGKHFIQIDKTDLICRPCTVFGKGNCFRKDFACMNWINVDDVLTEIKNCLNIK